MPSQLLNAHSTAPLSRRQMLQRCSTGFGMVALSSLLAESAAAAPKARAKSVIFCYMSGGVSQVDSFDPKPRLNAEHGKPMPVKVERTQFNQNGNIFGSPFTFKPYGESGVPVSSIFPEIGSVIDEIAVIRSMTSPVNEHAQGNYFFHTGFPFLGHPSAGAWINYGLGRENENLPGFVVLESGKAVPPHGGVGLYGSGFLPAQHQASIIEIDQPDPVRNIRPRELRESQQARLKLIESLDRQFADSVGGDEQVEAAIRNVEIACRMQTAVPELCDLSQESEEVKQLYGLDSKDVEKAAYARQCLLARRLVERGVPFIELSCLTKGIGAGGAANPWDQHGELERVATRRWRHQVDQPISALIHRSEAQRDLLDETTPDRLVRRIRSNSVFTRQQRPRPQPLRVQRLGGGRRIQGRDHLRRHRRVRLSRRREQGHGLRPVGHRAASAGSEPQGADLSLWRPRLPAHRCARQRHPRRAGVA